MWKGRKVQSDDNVHKRGFCKCPNSGHLNVLLRSWHTVPQLWLFLKQLSKQPTIMSKSHFQYYLWKTNVSLPPAWPSLNMGMTVICSQILWKYKGFSVGIVIFVTLQVDKVADKTVVNQSTLLHDITLIIIHSLILCLCLSSEVQWSQASCFIEVESGHLYLTCSSCAQNEEHFIRFIIPERYSTWGNPTSDQ